MKHVCRQQLQSSAISGKLEPISQVAMNAFPNPMVVIVESVRGFWHDFLNYYPLRFGAND